MENKSIFTNLRELGDAAERTDVLEKKVKAALDRDCNKERNILQCPQESLTAIHDTRSQLKQMSNNALKILSTLQLLGHHNQRLLGTADKILEYLVSETYKTEEHLKKSGYIPPAYHTNDSVILDGSQCKENLKISVSDEEQGSCSMKQEVPSTTQEVEDEETDPDPLALPKSPDAPQGARKNIGMNCLVSPEAPILQSQYQNDNDLYKLPPISAGRFQTNAAHQNNIGSVKGSVAQKQTEFFPHLPESPNSPDLDIQQEQYRLLKTNDLNPASQMAKNVAMKKFFETPKAKAKVGNATMDSTKPTQWSAVPAYTSSDAPYFAVLNQLPQSPSFSETDFEPPTNHTNYKHPGIIAYTDCPESPEVDFKLHSRKSILNEVPEHIPSIDDDTVLLLRGGPITAPNMRSPDSPDLTEYSRRLPNVNVRFDEHLPATPPSPDLTCHLTYQKEDNAKENVDPSNERNLSSYQIKASQYENLPSYLKRLLSYDLSCECAEKILQNTFSLPGEKYSHVITKSKIEEIACLGGKTKSFIFMMTTLKIMKKISGTDYFEITV